jgi:tetratricopeptide (TPR) repeat protein
MTLFYMLYALGNAWQAVFELEEARAAYLEALEVAEAVPVPSHRIIMLSGLCANRALDGDREGARAYALEAVKARAGTPSVLVWLDLLRHREIEALLWGGDEGLACEEVARLGERLGSNRRFRVPYLRAKALLARRDGEASRAVEHLLEAEALAEELGLPGEAWQVAAEAGELLEECGEHEEARHCLGRAAEAVRGLARRIEDEGLRGSFLCASQVRRVLDAGLGASEVGGP